MATVTAGRGQAASADRQPRRSHHGDMSILITDRRPAYLWDAWWHYCPHPQKSCHHVPLGVITAFTLTGRVKQGLLVHLPGQSEPVSNVSPCPQLSCSDRRQSTAQMWPGHASALGHTCTDAQEGSPMAGTLLMCIQTDPWPWNCFPPHQLTRGHQKHEFRLIPVLML